MTLIAQPGSGVRLAELVGTLSLATDLARGRPLEQGLGVCVLAVGLGEETGLAEDDLTRVWYGALLRHIGCTADNHLLSAVVGDEIAFSAGLAGIDASSPEAFLGYLAEHLRRTASATAEARLARLPALAGGMREAAAAVCEVAELLADRLGLGPELRRDLALGAERFDGRGFLGRAGGGQVPVAVRVVQVAETARLAAQPARPEGSREPQGDAAPVGRAEAAMAVLGERAGQALDPWLVERFRAAGERLFERLGAGPLWDQVLACEPGPRPVLAGEALRSGLAAMAEFVDLKSPSTVGHSAAVARLAEAAAALAGLPAAEQEAAARAGLVHDLGRAAVSSVVWERPGPLSLDQRERVRLHAYYTERVLAASPALVRLGTLASLHHERLDGSGYHRGAVAAALPPVARVLAAADAYQAMTEPRPHRPALGADAAAAELRAEVRAGRLDPDAAVAVLAAAGQWTGRRRPQVAALTAREIQVLGLLARGRSNRQIAAALTIAPKTADAHVQHIYAKIGVSTRAAAAVFAMRHDLVGPAGRKGIHPMPPSARRPIVSVHTSTQGGSMHEQGQGGADPRVVVEAMARKDGGDLEGFLELFEPDCEIVFPGTVLHGIQEWRTFVSAYFDAFPDGHYELRRLESVGQTVFAEGVWSAVHTGTLRMPNGEIPPTGRRVAVPFALVVEVRNGRLASVHNYHDLLGFMAQLGLAPVPA